MFLDIFWADWLKIRCSIVWFVMLLVPLFISMVGVDKYISHIDVFQENHMVGWMGAWTQVEFLYGMMLLPMIIAAYVSLLCRYEYLHGGWKQMRSFPIFCSHIYLSKMAWATILVGLTNCMMLLFFIVIGWMMGVTGEVPWLQFFLMMLNGWLASIVLISLQLWISTQWENFSIPFMINFIFVIPNVYITNSKYGKFYPWSQPAYVMTPSDRLFVGQTFGDFYLIVFSAFLIFSVIGLWQFLRLEIR